MEILQSFDELKINKMSSYILNIKIRFVQIKFASINLNSCIGVAIMEMNLSIFDQKK